MDTIKKILPLLLFQCFLISGFSQKEINVSLKNKIPEDYRINENIILETDRELYLVGESINLVCLTAEPVFQVPLALSKVIYLEFYTPDNLVIEQIKIETINGKASGIFSIPKRLSTGKYYIRAYTNYMKNYGCRGFAYTSVSIINPFLEIAEEKTYSSMASVHKCTLYPEGGNMVYEQNNRVVCRLTDKEGKPVQGMARVLDDKDDVIATVATNNYGLGTFNIRPSTDIEYRIEATSGNDIVEMGMQIPAEAVALTLESFDSSSVQFRLKKYHSGNYPLFLTCIHYGKAIGEVEIQAVDSIVKIPLTDLPKGILHFRLQDTENRTISYKNIYNPAIQENDLKMYTDKKQYTDRDQVQLTVNASNISKPNVNISVSVFMIAENIMSNYKNTDHAARIKSDFYAFAEKTGVPVGEIVRDSILLYQVLEIIEPAVDLDLAFAETGTGELKYFPEYKGDLIFGRVENDSAGAIPNAGIIQTWIDTMSTMQTSLTDRDGNFYFKSERSGRQNVVLRQRKSAQGKIKLQSEFYPDFFTFPKDNVNVSRESKEVLQQQMLHVQVNDLYMKGRAEAEDRQRYPFYIQPDRNYYIRDYVAMSTLEEFLFEVVPGILPFRSKGKTIIRLPLPDMDASIGENPLFLVDGIPVYDADLVAGLKCSDLKYVSVLGKRYFYQGEMFDGILDIHSNAGDGSILSLPEEILTSRFIGLQQKSDDKAFDLDYKSSRIPDFRTQLYWNPSLNLDEDRIAEVNFTTPDNEGTYMVRCTVSYPNGNANSYYVTFNVD